MEGREQKQQQRQTAKEVIAVNVQNLIQQLEQGRSETLTANWGVEENLGIFTTSRMQKRKPSLEFNLFRKYYRC